MFDNYSTSLRVDDSPASLGLWDTAGQEDYDRLRVLSYEHADVFLLCFAIDNRKSYENLIHKWWEMCSHVQCTSSTSCLY